MSSSEPEPNRQMLYVEDDETLAQVTRRAFQRRGFVVNHCAEFEAARLLIGSRPFDYALLDLKLGYTSSLPLLELLLAKNPHAKAVLLTGYASIATAVQAIKGGAVDYLTKPATIGEILAAFSAETEAEEDKTGTDMMLESPSLKRLEWERIQQALMENGGNISATARQLKMHRRTLQRKLDKRPVRS